MRDAFGGVFMMRLMLAFITIFVAFTAVSLNYAKAFKIKNKVIDMIEQQEITDVESILSSTNPNYRTLLDNIVSNAKYVISCSKDPIQEYIKDDADKVIGVCYKGITITKNIERSDNHNIYYNIYTYGGWNLKSLNILLTLGGEDANSKDSSKGKWQISGEAKVVKK